MTIGKNILKYRKKNGLSQEDLGEKVNVTRQTISNWELDETSPNPEQLKLLSKVFKVSVDELIDNNAQGIVLTKLKITENQIEKIKRIIKGLLICLIILFVIDLLVFIICFTQKIGPFETKKATDNFLQIKETINCGSICHKF